MMELAGGVRGDMASGVTDVHKSINTLAILVAEQLDLDPLFGHLFAFCNRIAVEYAEISRLSPHRLIGHFFSSANLRISNR
jgi:transposase